MRQRFRNSLCVSLLSLTILSVVIGCPEKNENSDSRPEYWQTIKPDASFTILVVGDAEVAKKIRQTVGTWEELTQASLIVEETTVEELLANDQKPKADAVICPTELQITLVQRGYPAKITTSMLGEGGELWADLLEIYRTKLSRFGTDTTFVPFGAQFFACYYRADLLQQLKVSPPTNWEEYTKLQRRLQELGKDQANWAGALEPTAPDWAAHAFLARAASYVTHRDNYSTLFDIRTMSPLIASEPFVRALTEMQAANPMGTPRLTGHEVRRAFWQGETAMAITYPTAALIDGLTTEKANVPDFKAGIAMIPGSMQAFHSEKKIWDERRREESPHIPTLISGHVGLISTETSDPVGMFKLLLWLSSKEWGTEVFASSPMSGIGRKSEIEQVSRWIEKEAMSEQTMKMQYISLLSKHWNADNAFFMPSLPGYTEYMGVLDHEVRQVLDGKKEPQAALDETARQWEAITEKHGLESQRDLYRRSYGLTGN